MCIKNKSGTAINKDGVTLLNCRLLVKHLHVTRMQIARKCETKCMVVESFVLRRSGRENVKKRRTY